jgi:hypothetical protein
MFIDTKNFGFHMKTEVFYALKVSGGLGALFKEPPRFNVIRRVAAARFLAIFLPK